MQQGPSVGVKPGYYQPGGCKGLVLRELKWDGEGPVFRYQVPVLVDGNVIEGSVSR